MLAFVLNTIAALSLGIFWLRFFRQVDGFEKESWRASLICLVMGLLSPLITFIISPFLDGFFNKQELVGLLGHAVFQVGAVEELSKILPFLILLLKTDWINESIDYIKYPAISAIGFATTENILYTMENGLDVLQFRAVLCIPGHIFFTSVCGFFLYKGYKNQNRFSPLHFLLGYSIGVLAHGFYDFFLFTRSSLAIFSFGLAAVFVVLIKRIIFHSIRDSEFFDESKLPEIFRAGRQLLLGMVFLFFFTALSAGVVNGTFDASIEYAKSNGIMALITTGIFLVLIGLDEKGYRKVLGLPPKS
jgi:RsiW-degrading membrane proteinase PrsW (M82 family)